MTLSPKEKQDIKQSLADTLSQFHSVKRVVIFGSFCYSSDPHDVDVAVFEESSDDYLSLAMKYRKETRDIAKKIPLDLIPIAIHKLTENDSWLQEINKGETIYER